ncbi:MAG: hypothetical protein JXA42_25290 [Anaerolineales bacterium]|nr:hypothetical protein [Anaerolineales bacterium]
MNEKLVTERERKLYKQDWLMIYLPMILGLVIVITFIVLLAIPGFQSQNLGRAPLSNWGDASAILVIIQVAIISLIPLILIVGLAVLFFYLYIKSQPLLKQAEMIFSQIFQKTDHIANQVTDTMIKPYSFCARLRTLFKYLRRPNV